MIGTTFGHYQITRKLGSGGMGEVYLADDTRLRRQVAIKILPEALSSDPESRARLLREAQAASQLNHPNIVTVYAVEEFNGRAFLVMEYVEGTTLSEHLDAGSTVTDILQLLTQVAQGLERAHRSGVVHRDLKPANILVDGDSRARILDFGIAKLAGATKLTRTGMTVGTIAYSSPEQVTGQDVDARSDIFSFGVVFYEALAHRRPFEGEHESTLIYAILSEDPEPIRSLNPSVPESVERIALRCLSKKPENRYQSVGELIADLNSVAADPGTKIARPVTGETERRAKSRMRLAMLAVLVTVLTLTAIIIPRYFNLSRTPSRLMLAVLPFESEGADDKEYFADGITEEITARLARISGLGVIARSSARQYKNTTKSPHEVAAELGVEYLLTGTIRWLSTSGGAERVRVMPELIRVSDEVNIWGELYDRALSEIFDVQSEIAQQVAAQLNVTLLEGESAHLRDKPTENLQAYEFYMRGLEYMNRNSDWHQTSDLSIPMFERAIALDPKFVSAHARMGQMLIEVYWHTDRQDEYLTRARAAIDAALAIDATDPDAHVAWASYLYHEGHYDSALVEFERVLQLNPNSTYALSESGHAYRRSGEFKKAALAFTRVVELDPRAHLVWLELGRTLRYMRQYERADSALARAAVLLPEWTATYDEQFWSALNRGRFEDAKRVLESGERVVRPAAALSTHWAWWYLYRNDPESALEKLSIDIADSVTYYYMAAWAHRIGGDMQASHAAADSGRVVAENRLRGLPNTSYLHQNLGLHFALLGRKEEALREARHALELISYGSDTQNSIPPLEALSIVCGLTGEFEAACDALDTLVVNPSYLSRKIVGYSFEWQPLHGYPRFEALIKQRESVIK